MNAQAGKQRRHHAVGLRNERHQQVNRLDLLVLVPRGNFLGALDRFSYLGRQIPRSMNPS